MTGAASHRSDTEKRFGYVWLVGFTAAIGGFLFGFDTGVIGGAMPALEKHFAMSPKELGFAVASVFIGSIAGGIIGGVLSDLFGRRRVLILTGICFLASALLAGLAQTSSQFNVGRLIGGVGIGISLPIVGVYLAEIAPVRMRGRIVSLNQLVITFGIFISYVVGWGVSNIGDEAWQTHSSWRWAFASQAVPSALFIAALALIPESPRWLVQKGRVAEALGILSQVDGHETAAAAVADIQRTIALEKGTIRQLFRPGMRKALFIGMMLSLFDQLTGINIVLYYIQPILGQLKFGTRQTRQGMLLLGLNNFATTIIALAVVDRLSRKSLLIFPLLAMAVSWFFVGVQFFTEVLPPVFVLFAIMAFCFCYAVGPGPVNLLILAEIFPTRVRGQAAGYCTLFMWVSCYVISERFPQWFQQSEAGMFWTLAGMCLLYAAFVWLLVPETKGKSLEQIEQYWKSLLHRRADAQST